MVGFARGPGLFDAEAERAGGDFFLDLDFVETGGGLFDAERAGGDFFLPADFVTGGGLFEADRAGGDFFLFLGFMTTGAGLFDAERARGEFFLGAGLFDAERFGLVVFVLGLDCGGLVDRSGVGGGGGLVSRLDDFCFKLLRGMVLVYYPITGEFFLWRRVNQQNKNKPTTKRVPTSENIRNVCALFVLRPARRDGSRRGSS